MAFRFLGWEKPSLSARPGRLIEGLNDDKRNSERLVVGKKYLGILTMK